MNQENQEGRSLAAAGPELGLFVLIPFVFMLLGVLAALLFSGLGHGTPFFSRLFAAPLPSAIEGSWLGPLVVWVPLAMLMPFRCYSACRIASAGILAVHYIGVALLIRDTDWYFVRDVWQKMSPLPALWVGIYLIAQSILIGLLVRSTWRFRRLAQESRTPLHST